MNPPKTAVRISQALVICIFVSLTNIINLNLIILRPFEFSLTGSNTENFTMEYTPEYSTAIESAKKLTRFVEHLRYTKTCQQKGVITTALKLSIPNPPVYNTELISDWQTVLDDTSRRLNSMLISVYEKHTIPELRKQYDKAMQNLKSSLSSSEFGVKRRAISNSCLSLRRSIQARHNQKIAKLIQQKQTEQHHQQQHETIETATITSTPPKINKNRHFRRSRRRARNHRHQRLLHITKSLSTSTQHNIVNLSDRPLSPDENSLLQLLLSYCPIPPCYNHARELMDVETYVNRIRFFSYQPTSITVYPYESYPSTKP